MNFNDIYYKNYEEIQEWQEYIKSTEKSINFIHLNICSLRKHFNELSLLLNGCLHNLDVICLTEINIRGNELYNYEIKGFNHYYYTREERRGGGILIYIKNILQFEIIPNEPKLSYCELLHGELKTQKNSLHLLVIYKPPHTKKDLFVDEIESIIRKIPFSNEIIFLGDCNINLLECALDRYSSNYLDTLSECGLQCGIADVTREVIVAERRVTSCIDHVFVRSARTDEMQAYVLKCNLSDHYLTGLTIPSDGNNMSLPSSREVLDNLSIARKLRKINWTDLLTIDNPLEQFNKLCDIFSNIYNSSKKVINHSSRGTRTWTNTKLIIMMEHKDRLFKIWKSDPNSQTKRLDYTNYRNKVHRLINAAKNAEKRKEVKNCNGDMRRLWNKLNSWLGRSKLSTDDVIKKYLLRENITLEHVCNNFCQTFTGEIEQLKSKHICNNNFFDRHSYVHSCNISFRYKKVDSMEISKMIDNMDCNKSPGIDGIRVRDLKLVKEHVSPILASFINNCIKQGVYPDILKTAIVRPIFKQGSHKDYSNYRPIAILSTINKIFEKIIVGQIGRFLETHNILTKFQFGFRPNRSTAEALAAFSDDINNALNNKNIVLALFVDFKKAFDTLSHEGLLQSMEECGIRGPVNIWFRKYLERRNIIVRVSGVDSTLGKIRYGVPTGSVFGPVGFIMHVNSMANVVNNSRIYMYADDTCLVYSGHNSEEIQLKVQQDLNNIIRWAHDNGILINLNKTKYMLIASPYNPYVKSIDIVLTGHTYECLHAKLMANNCNCDRLELVTKYKYLGLIVDSRFSWDLHVDSVCSRLRSILGKLNHIRFVVGRGILYMLYYALADATISYGLCAYGITFPTYINKIKALQIRLLKIIIDTKTKKEIENNYDKIFKICNILPVAEKIKSTLILEQFKIHTYKKKISHKRPQRKVSNKKTFVVPKVTNYFGRRTRQWVIPTYCNEIAHLDLETLTKNQLKNLLRKHYLSLCP